MKSKFNTCCSHFVFLFVVFSFMFSSGIRSVASPSPGHAIDSIHFDTVYIKKCLILIGEQIVIDIPRDTFYLQPVRIRQIRDTSSYRKSQLFYDSVYKKLNRKKFTRFIYNLAFQEPRVTPLADSIQVEGSEVPFKEYRGKIIRKIEIKSLDPFGPTIMDTTGRPLSGVGKALDKIHINTRNYIIRRNLLFKKGDPLNPDIVGDNERILRDLESIDDARIIITPSKPGSDSVDLMVITKDVWSIGFDIPVLTPKRTRFRLYDANFLGLNDRLTTNMSLEVNRAPFFLFEGLDYTFSNIGGSFINASLAYFADGTGDRAVSVLFNRPFITNQMKWAGGAGATWWKDNAFSGDSLTFTSYYKNESVWFGRAFILKGQGNISRFVLSAAVYRTHFSSRPFVSIDSNRGYYNTLQVLGSISFSRNNYYITDYVSQFGKTENLAYGHLFQITFGPDYTDFYNRFYTGLTIAAGKYFKNFGFIEGSIKIGGFIYRDAYEDAVLKITGNYFTPLTSQKNNPYKVRTFLTADYVYGFNFRTNNKDLYDANLRLKVDRVSDINVFRGKQVITAGVSTVLYTPWYFYGFRLALFGNLQGGVIGSNGQSLFKSSFFTGIGTGILIKNDNLVFPMVMISGYFYPNPPDGINRFQGFFSSNIGIDLFDFNVSAPHEEGLGN